MHPKPSQCSAFYPCFGCLAWQASGVTVPRSEHELNGKLKIRKSTGACIGSLRHNVETKRRAPIGKFHGKPINRQKPSLG